MRKISTGGGVFRPGLVQEGDEAILYVRVRDANGLIDIRQPAAEPDATEVRSIIETEIRYAGYIAREERIIRDIQRHENVKIPDDFDYAPIETMTLESREKLTKIRPRTLAQAGRIPGVSPSDLAQLSIVLLKLK
jgi:tRNA U34 5-carboxymethylaminomethyl modifying enzyme MnmG/GidA